MPDFFRGIDNRHFYHQVTLPDGETTPGVLSPVKMAGLYGLNTLDFRHRSVLDVAAWSGGWSFLAEARGASRVTAYDCHKCRYGDASAFNLIKSALGSKVEYLEGNVYNLWSAVPEQSYDIVFCFGLLYHLSDPLYALRNCMHAAKQFICIETVAHRCDTPLLELLAPGEYFNDQTNVYCPTTGWLKFVMARYGWSCRFDGDTLAHLPPNRCRVAMIFEKTESENAWSWLTLPHPQLF